MVTKSPVLMTDEERYARSVLSAQWEYGVDSAEFDHCVWAHAVYGLSLSMSAWWNWRVRK